MREYRDHFFYSSTRNGRLARTNHRGSLHVTESFRCRKPANFTQKPGPFTVCPAGHVGGQVTDMAVSRVLAAEEVFSDGFEALD
jgi:hypothetical protein